jgi:hypothetical protein
MMSTISHLTMASFCSEQITLYRKNQQVLCKNHCIICCIDDRYRKLSERNNML